MDFPPEFSDNEVREELARLGYTNIPNDKLREFRKGKLFNLVWLHCAQCLMLCIMRLLFSYQDFSLNFVFTIKIMLVFDFIIRTKCPPTVCIFGTKNEEY